MFGSKKKNGASKIGKTTFVIICGCAGSGKTSLGEKLSRELGWTYLDKDSVTRDFTDFILVDKGKLKSDRESDLYCDVIRPIEYEVTFKVCEENLRLGNSVILTIPFIAQIKDYHEWKKMVEKYNMDLDDINVKFIWINHDEGSEYTRITKRGAERDGYKLSNWEEYARGIADIKPDDKYEAYCYDNDSASADELYVKDVLEWIRK